MRIDVGRLHRVSVRYAGWWRGVAAWRERFPEGTFYRLWVGWWLVVAVMVRARGRTARSQ